MVLKVLNRPVEIVYRVISCSNFGYCLHLYTPLHFRLSPPQRRRWKMQDGKVKDKTAGLENYRTGLPVPPMHATAISSGLCAPLSRRHCRAAAPWVGGGRRDGIWPAASELPAASSRETEEAAPI